MLVHMLSEIYRHEIPRKIVTSIVIPMMNVFTFFKFSSIVLFPDKAMFEHVTAGVCEMMFRHIKQHVTLFGAFASAFPSMRAFAALVMAMDISKRISGIFAECCS